MDGKLNFLEENQAVYHWAAELNSSFLYRRANDGVAEWSAYGILDGFLAAEFLWALACDEKLDLVLRLPSWLVVKDNDFSLIGEMTKLQQLSLHDVAIDDCSFLAKCVKLSAGPT